jgi:hypothetical protein
MPRPIATSGICIACGDRITHKIHGGGEFGAKPWWEWRCDDPVECAVRRNAKKKRPRPEAEVRARYDEIRVRNRKGPSGPNR